MRLVIMRLVIYTLLVLATLASARITTAKNEKALNKLLNKKENVLIVFHTDSLSQDFKAILKKSEVVGKKKGGVATVNCDKYQDLCDSYGAKLSIQENGEEMDIQFFFEGRFAKVYDKELTQLSISTFLLDPRADIPWPKATASKDVVFAGKDNFDSQVLESGKPSIAMFYAPWCGHCKRFKPAFQEAATVLEEAGSDWQMVAVNCDLESTSKICRRYDVTGFPTIKYFNDGEFEFDYEYGRDIGSILDFVRDPQPDRESQNKLGPFDSVDLDELSSPSKSPVDWSPTGVQKFATSQDYTDGMNEFNSGSTLVLFWHSDCGADCDTLRQVWEDVSAAVKIQGLPVTVAAVNLALGDTVSSFTSEPINGNTVPTIVHYHEGKYDKVYEGGRSAAEILTYLDDPMDLKRVKTWQEEYPSSAVEHLEPNNFDSFINDSSKPILLMAYAPWCGHCKKLKPHYTKVAEKVQSDVSLAAIDCSEFRSTCEPLGVTGYPSLFWFPAEAGVDGFQDVSMGRDEEGIMEFLGKTGALSSSHDEL